MIEHHGLRVVDERTYQIVPGATPASAPVWLHDMTIEANDGKPIVIGTEFNHRLETSIMAVVGDRAESDGYNALILRTALGWREISTIRALSHYLHQIGKTAQDAVFVERGDRFELLLDLGEDGRLACRALGVGGDEARVEAGLE